MRKFVVLFAGLALAAISSGAVAVPAFPIHTISTPSLELKAACPPGSHPGYLGRHCWPDRGSSCPPGYHRGYLGRHCWRN